MAKKKAKFYPGAYPYPECREQHVWLHFDGTVDEKAKIGYRVQKCLNCPTKRHQTISARAENRGQVLKSAYVYPDDYQVEGGLGRSERGLIRWHNFLADLEQ